MQLAGRNPDLGPHAEFAAIGKLGRGVAQQNGRVQPLEEPLCRGIVLGQDRFGMLAAIVADMGNRPVDAIHQPGGDDHVQKLAPEIIRRCRHRPRHVQQFALGPHLDSGLHQVLDQHRPVACVEGAVDEQTFRRATDAGAPGLGVYNHAPRLLQVSIAIGIDMADAFQMGKNRHPRLALHQPDQALAAARHDHVDVLDRAQHGTDHLAVAGRHQLNCGCGKVGPLQSLDHAGMDRGRGMKAFRPAAQDHRIAGLQTQRPGVGGDVGTAFIDHPDHPQRRAHPADVQPAGHVPFGHNLAHRVLLRRDRPQPVNNAAHPALVQPQPVHHRRTQALGRGIGQVFGIGRDDRAAPRPDRLCRANQRRLLAPGAGTGQFCRRRPRRLPDLFHQAVVRRPVHRPHLCRVPKGQTYRKAEQR